MAFSKELGFYKTAAGKIEVFLPKFFLQVIVEKIGAETAEHYFPGIVDHLQNMPSKEGFAAIVAQNHTGNHYRNKPLRIPVQPGQPVRG